MAGCEPVFVPLVPPTFSFDPNVLEDAFRSGAKAIIICNPSNPSGKVFTEAELKTIAELCIRYDVYAIMDEVYEHIIYDGRRHIYMNSLPGMWERTISCSSLSKTYSITGWRLGYAIAPENIMTHIRQYHDFTAVGCASPLMEAAIVGLNMPQSYYEEFGAHYAHMKKVFTDGLRSIGIPFTDPEGTYFVLADIAPYLKKGRAIWISANSWRARPVLALFLAAHSSANLSIRSSVCISQKGRDPLRRVGQAVPHQRFAVNFSTICLQKRLLSTEQPFQ